MKRELYLQLKEIKNDFNNENNYQENDVKEKDSKKMKN